MTRVPLISKLDALWLTLLAWAIVFVVENNWAKFSDGGRRTAEVVVLAILILACVRAMRLRKESLPLALLMMLVPLASIAVIVLVIVVAVGI